MKDKIKIAVLQYGLAGDIQAMQSLVGGLIKQAAENGAELVCLPEFSLTPYFPGTRCKEGFNYAEELENGASCQFFKEQSRVHKLFIIGSFYQKEQNNFFDTAVIYDRGILCGFTKKVHIPSGEGYYETDFFGGGEEYPVHDLGKLKVSVPTCYDQWFMEVARISSLNGAEFLFYPTAIGSEPTDPNMDTRDAWRAIQIAHAIGNGVFVAAANRIGQENGVTFYGSSFICAPNGTLLASAGRDTQDILVADLDPAIFDHWRNLFPLLAQRKPATYQRIVDPLDQSPLQLPDRFHASRVVNK